MIKDKTLKTFGYFLEGLKKEEVGLESFSKLFDEDDLTYLYNLAKIGEKTEVYFGSDKEKILNNEEETKRKIKKLKIDRKGRLSPYKIEDENEGSIYNSTYLYLMDFKNDCNECLGQLEIYFILTGFEMENEKPFIDIHYSVPFFNIEIEGDIEGLDGIEALKYIMKNHFDELWNIVDWGKEVLYEEYGIVFDEDFDE